jgi:hypothetical protein
MSSRCSVRAHQVGERREETHKSQKTQDSDKLRLMNKHALNTTC